MLVGRINSINAASKSYNDTNSRNSNLVSFGSIIAGEMRMPKREFNRLTQLRSGMTKFNGIIAEIGDTVVTLVVNKQQRSNVINVFTKGADSVAQSYTIYNGNRVFLSKSKRHGEVSLFKKCLIALLGKNSRVRTVEDALPCAK